MTISKINYHSNTLPFSECLSVLEHSGKRLYGKHFRIIEEDHPVIFKHLNIDGWPLNNEREKNWVLEYQNAKACLSPDAIGMSLLLRALTTQFFSSGFIGLDFFAYFLHQGRKYEPVRLEDINKREQNRNDELKNQLPLKPEIKYRPDG